MNRVQLSTCAFVVLILGSMLATSAAQRNSRNSRNGGFMRNTLGRLRFQERRREQEATDNRRACFALSGLFTRRDCVRERNPICTAFAFLIKNGGFECEQFPCTGYGGQSRSVCVPTGECTRLTLSKGLCGRDQECCIQSSNT